MLDYLDYMIGGELKKSKVKIGQNQEIENINILQGYIHNKNINPLNNKPYSHKWQMINKKVAELPANNLELKSKLFQTLDKYPLVILSGDTGSGKSTQTGKHLLEYFNYSEKVVVTQPRTLNASSIAGRVADELDVVLGEEVGYNYHNNRKMGDRTLLSFVTDGTLMNQLFMNKDKLEYQGIIIDEAHERDIYIDFLLLYIKQYLLNNPKTTKRFVIMSATLDLDKFAKYFKGIPFGTHTIPGRTFPVERHYLTQSVDNYTPVINDKIYHILKTSISGDIVIFLNSKAELDRIKESIEKFVSMSDLPENKKNIVIYQLYRGVPEKERELATDSEKYKSQKGKPTRKIVLATNIAETGVTIDGLKYVIDNGRHLEMKYNFKKRQFELDNSYITKAAAKQRAGRAGRTAPGICYHLYTEKEFNKFANGKTPDIQNSKLEQTFLMFLGNKNILLENSNELKKMFNELIDPPSADQYKYTFEALHNFNLVDKQGSKYSINDLGMCLTDLNTNDIETGLILLLGKLLGIESEIVKLIAVKIAQPQLTKYYIPPKFEIATPDMPDKKRMEIINKNIKSRKTFAEKQSKIASNTAEILAYYNLYQTGLDKQFSDSWIKTNHLNKEYISGIIPIINELEEKLNYVGDTCINILLDKLNDSKEIKHYLEKTPNIKYLKNNISTISTLGLHKKILIPFLYIYNNNHIKLINVDDKFITIEYQNNKYSLRKTPFLTYFSQNMLFTDINIIDDNPVFAGLINY